DAVAAAFCDFIQPLGTWSGTASMLLRELTGSAEHARNEKDWPKRANGLSGCLREAGPWLKEQGVDISYRRGARQRMIEITCTPPDRKHDRHRHRHVQI